MASAPTTSTPAAEALLGALADRPGASAAELAAAAGIGRSTAGKLLATLAAQGRVERQPSGLRNGRRTADRWTLPTPTPTQDPGLPPTAAPARPADQPPRRLRSGQLRDLVLGYLADRSGQALSPTAIAKTRWCRPRPSHAATPSPPPTAATTRSRSVDLAVTSMSAAGGAPTPPAGAHQETGVPDAPQAYPPQAANRRPRRGAAG